MKQRLISCVCASILMLGCGAEDVSEASDSVADTVVSDVATTDVLQPNDATSSDVATPDAMTDDVVGPVVSAYDFGVAPTDGEVRAGVIQDASGLIAGPKSEGRLGDIRMDNAHVAFVLEGVRRTSGYSYWGGNVTDVAIRRADGSYTPDYFGELFVGWNLDIFRPESVEVVDDGRGSGVAHVRFVGETSVLYFAQSAIGGFLNLKAPELGLVYDYTLGADDRSLSLTVTLQNTKQSAVWIDWPIILSHAGDGIFNYVPEHGFVDLNGQALPYYGMAGREVGYALVSERQDITSFYAYAGVSILQIEYFDIPPQSEVTRSFHFLATDQGPAGLDMGFREVLGFADDAEPVTGTVTLPESATVDATWVAVHRSDDDAVMGIAPVDAGGGYAFELVPGDYTIVAYSEGHSSSPTVSVTVPGDAPGPVAIPASARVLVRVSETTTGAPTPARVTFIRSGETPGAYAPTEVRPAQKTWSGDRSAVAYVTGAEEWVTLPAGTYQVTATRGPTHEIDQRVLTFEAGEPTELDMAVEQVIDTTGWLSGDFHIHAWWSPDSYVPWTTRARQAATEDLDLPILTEHVYIGSLQGSIEETETSGHTIGITGQEVTSFDHGHFNAFPLAWREDEPNRGAVLPYDKVPGSLFDAIRDQHPGDEVIQINHPRGSNISSYFSYVGLNAAADTVSNQAHWSTNWDAIEVFNGGCGGGAVVDDWVGLTNHGYRKTLAAGSDSHGEAGLIGTPRNWIQVDEAAVRADAQALVAPVRERRAFISCGPFVRFNAVNTAGETLASLGELTEVDDTGDVSFHIVVEAPTWITLDEVRLWENGQVIRVEDITTAADPIVRFDAVWSVTPTADAWYSVEVVGSGSMAPVTWSGPPYALTNPIEVDADGDGTWTPPGM